MNIKRMINTQMWNDPEIVDKFSPEDKYFWLYLLTNPHNDLTGVAKLSIKTMAFELGYSVEVIKILIDRFANEFKKIDYCEESGEILVINWYKYNWNSSPKVINSIKNKVGNIKNNNFKNYIIELLNELENGHSIDTLSIPYRYLSNTNTNTISNTISNTNTNIVEIIERKENNNQTYKEIIDYLNATTNSCYKPLSKTKALIRARIADGYSIDDFKRVIDNMVFQWGKDQKMKTYLRPSTLFSNKFENYLNYKVSQTLDKYINPEETNNFLEGMYTDDRF